MDPVALLLVQFGVSLNVGAQVALKYSTRPSVPAEGSVLHLLIAQATNPWLLLAFALYGISVFNWRLVLERLPLGVAYPLTSLGFVMTFVLGVVLFHEPLSVTRMVGIAVIILGVFLLFRPA